MNARAAEAATLAELGAAIQDATVEVRLPAALAERAVAAWQRDDNDPVPEDESPAAKHTRHQAGTLALIGLAITERGRQDGDAVAVALPVEIAGQAVAAATDLG